MRVGKNLIHIAFLSHGLTVWYGRGFSERTLREARQFFRAFPIWRTACAKSGWSHFRNVLRVDDLQVRSILYLEESAGPMAGG
jgi:hypothetical protein